MWRCYTGGVLLDDFVGNSPASDGNFPEDWLASTTIAQNGPHQQHAWEGMSYVRMPDGSQGPRFLDVLKCNSQDALGCDGFSEEAGIGVLCKFLDSAVRLPIQCHPDVAFAREYYGSEHGKTESWLVLGTRRIDNEDPYLLMGFKPDLDPELFRQAVRNQNIPQMEQCLHRIAAEPGDMYFVPGRLPHAIGPGVFLLEVQEPTDWVVQPERFIGETELTDSDMWGPLDPETALDCFDYAGADTLANITDRLALRPQIIWQNEDAVMETIIGPERTDCFRVDKLTVRTETNSVCEWPWHIAVITQGRSQLQAGDYRCEIGRGDCFFVPNSVKTLRYTATDSPVAIFMITKS